MPPSRLLLPLCGLLLALAVTTATAQAPLYEAGKLNVVTAADPALTTRDRQVSRCSSLGGSLVPMSTEAVFNLVTNALDGAGVWSSFSYMGGSTMLSSSACTTTGASLDCVWFWDEGRYSGFANALAFYRGNRDAGDLPGAGMMTTSVKNYWRLDANAVRCPCEKMERYGAVLRDEEGLPYWSDTSSTSYSYSAGASQPIYRLCGIDSVKATTSKPGNSVASRPLVVGLPVAAALVVMAVVAWS